MKKLTNEKTIDELLDESFDRFVTGPKEPWEHHGKLTKPKAKFRKHDIKHHAQQFIEAIDKEFNPDRLAALKNAVETYRRNHPTSTTEDREM